MARSKQKRRSNLNNDNQKTTQKKQQLKNKYSPTECCKARLALALALHKSEFIVFFFVTQKKSNKIQIGNIGKNVKIELILL